MFDGNAKSIRGCAKSLIPGSTTVAAHAHDGPAGTANGDAGWVDTCMEQASLGVAEGATWPLVPCNVV